MYPHAKPDDKQPGDSAHSVADLSGNVWKWCLNEGSNPERFKEEGSATRVLRGGSWFDPHVNAAAPFRYRNHPVNRNDNYGFRVVAGLAPP
jgi:formylglycine-generating enzyme required for sulfatase activity